MQLYNPLTIVPSSGTLSLWPSHSFWDPNLIKKCPPVPTIACTRMVGTAKNGDFLLVLAVKKEKKRARRRWPAARKGRGRVKEDLADLLHF
jgi:hypothetical protein